MRKRWMRETWKPGNIPVDVGYLNGSQAGRVRLALATLLVLLWAIYFAYRAINGFSAVSDEYFYFTSDATLENKRVIFIWFTQQFDTWGGAHRAISFLNIVAVVVAFYLITRINFGNAAATFILLLYFAAIANYVFRDSFLLLLVALYASLVLRRSWKALLLCVPVLWLMGDFRPHFVPFLLLSLAAAYIGEKLRSDAIVIALAGIVIVCVFSTVSIIGENFYIYGITASEFIAGREERHQTTLTPISFIYGLAVHYLAPTPLALFMRAITGVGDGLESVYGRLDDIYRFIYRCFLYYIFVYLAINWRAVRTVFARWRFAAFFFLTFSLANASLYTMFTFGAGHERVKIFSALVLFFLYSGVTYLKREHRQLRVIQAKGSAA